MKNMFMKYKPNCVMKAVVTVMKASLFYQSDSGTIIRRYDQIRPCLYDFEHLTNPI